MYFEYILRVFEHFLVSYDERSFGSRGSVIDAKSDYILYCMWMQYCWCKIWGFWIWNESILTLPASPLLCLSSPLAKTSEELLIKFLNKCLKNVNFNKLRSNEFEESIINIRKLVIHQVFLYALILAVHPIRIIHLLSPIKFELLNDILG